MKKKTSKLALTSLGFTLLMSGLVGCSPKKMLKLKEETVTKELGETVSLDPKEYLVDDTTQEILEKTVLDSELLKDEGYVVNDKEKSIISKDKEYLNIGEYTFTLTYNESENKEVKVIVQDTTAPTFKDFKEEIKVEQNAKDVDFNAFFTCEDLSVCKVETDSSAVDLSNTGEAVLKVSATDEYDNKLEKEVKVIIVLMEEARKEDGVTKTVDGTVFKSEALVKKEEEEKKAEEQKKNQQSNSSSNSNSNSSNSGSVANSGGSTNTGGNTSGGSSNDDVYIYMKDLPPEFHPDQEQIAFAEINRNRAALGKDPLTMADDLNELADIRSQELVNEYATGTVHSGLSKYDPFWQGLADKSLGEVAGVATLALVEDYDGYDIVRRWMNSPAHRASIMDENGMDRMEIGISCYTVAGSVYWIAVIR